MKRLFLLALLLSSQFSKAQDHKAADSLVNHLKELYNTNQYTALYNLLSADFKQQQSEKQITSFYTNSLKAPLGNINSIAYLRNSASTFFYTVDFEHTKLQLTLEINELNKINGMLWKPIDKNNKVHKPIDTKLIKTNNPRKTKLELYVDSLALSYLSDPGNCSLSIGIINGDKVTTLYYGETKKGNGQLPNGKTWYEIGSISKTFTGIMLAHAVNEGKIKLDDDIRKYLPGEYPNLQFEGQPITIKELSNHSSGIPSLPINFGTRPGYHEDNPYAGYSREMIYQFIKGYKPSKASGTTVSYSNLAVALLGIILEDVYKKPLEELKTQWITGPLKMKGTRYDLLPAQINRLTTGYNAEEEKEVHHWDLDQFKAAGGIKSDLEDMLIYTRANIKESNPDIKLSHQPTFSGSEIFNCGLNWVITTQKNNDIRIWHNGETAGYHCYCGFVKGKRTGIVILNNSNGNVDKMAVDILNMLPLQIE